MNAKDYRNRLLDIHGQEMDQALNVYGASDRQALLEGAIARGVAAEQGARAAATAGGLGALGALQGTSQGVLSATTAGLSAAQGARLEALGVAQDIQDKRSGYELAVEESALAQRGAESAALARINEAKRAAAQRTREAMGRYAGAAVGAASGAMSAGSDYFQGQGDGELSAYERAQKQRKEETDQTGYGYGGM
jgi:hypothetical protein